MTRGLYKPPRPASNTTPCSVLTVSKYMSRRLSCISPGVSMWLSGMQNALSDSGPKRRTMPATRGIRRSRVGDRALSGHADPRQ